jgi:hypothetical protein
LCAAGISIIAGTEYRHTASNKLISEALLILSDNRLGHYAFAKIWQPKLEPAVGEDKELISMYGKCGILLERSIRLKKVNLKF